MELAHLLRRHWPSGEVVILAPVSPIDPIAINAFWDEHGRPSMTWANVPERRRVMQPDLVGAVVLVAFDEWSQIVGFAHAQPITPKTAAAILGCDPRMIDDDPEDGVVRFLDRDHLCGFLDRSPGGHPRPWGLRDLVVHTQRNQRGIGTALLHAIAKRAYDISMAEGSLPFPLLFAHTRNAIYSEGWLQRRGVGKFYSSTGRNQRILGARLADLVSQELP